MSYRNNRAAARPRSSFQTAGGSIFLFRHPFLAGQISAAVPIDQVDVSRAMRLNDTFFEANPAQDNSFQEVLVDGSVVTITNHLSNGNLNMQVIETTGFVGTGDFLACLHLIIATKDDIGGTLTVKRWFNGVARTRVYYGVSCKNVPHERIAGNAVVPYSVSLAYAGWVEGASMDVKDTAKTIWAVGNKYGLSGVYAPYGIQLAEQENASENYYKGRPNGGLTGGHGDGTGGGGYIDKGDIDKGQSLILGTDAPAGETSYGGVGVTEQESDTWTAEETAAVGGTP
jgi:hypothetical protein